MNYLKIAICICANPILIFRYGIGAEKFGFGLLNNENETSNEQALSKMLARIAYSLGTILYLYVFLVMSRILDMDSDIVFLKAIVYLAVLAHVSYQMYFIFYPAEKQNLLGFGQPILANTVLSFLIKGYSGLSPHKSNAYLLSVWTLLGLTLYLSEMYLSLLLIAISITCFGIIALNLFVIEKENIKAQLIGKQKDKILNDIEPETEGLQPEKKTENIISKPL